MGLILIVLLVLILVGSLPVWPYSRGWGAGYYPAGGVTLVIVVLIVLALAGAIPLGW